MIFNMKFVSDGLQTVFDMKIRLRISPVHLYLITPSYKSFLLWKWNLWCIIWFSLWKWPFILYGSCYSRGAPAPFHFMVGVSSGRRESETLGSLWITRGVFIRETRVHPSQLYMSISGFIMFMVNHESDYSSRTYSQPGITALPRITADDCHNHNTEQPLLLSLKPRLILYSNESCHTSRADTICAVSL